MIANIVDRRNRKYRWKSVQAIIEAAWHDNTCNDSDQADVDPEDKSSVTYDERDGISISEAVTWAHEQTYLVTLYLYDRGTN